MSKTIGQVVKNPLTLFMSMGHRGWFNWMSDKAYLKMAYWISMRAKLNLDSPRTFSEKLQWLKLYDRRPEYTKMVDKYKVKQYVSDRIGSQYVIPTLGVWDRFDDIDFDALPDRFVLKCTHDSGGLVLCKDKSKLDISATRRKINGCLRHNYFWGNREWPYKNVKPRIIAEQYLDPSPNKEDLTDYKWFCFDGEPKYCQVIQDRNTKETIDFFDTEWRHQEFVGLNPAAVPAAVPPARPRGLDTQVRIARELSKGMPFSRIDLYEVGEREYFGEITFYPASGFGEFHPEEYNEILGRMISLPGEKYGMGGVKLICFRTEVSGLYPSTCRTINSFAFAA